MKKILSILLLILLLQVQTSALVLPSGTAIVVQPQYEIDADDVKIGSQVKFTVAQPVKVDNTVAIKVGTEIIAKVVKKKNNGILGISGYIQLGEFSIINSNNEIIMLSGSISDYGDNRYWANVGWIFVFPLLFIKGNDGKIPKHSTHILYTIEDSNI
ncbi:hypothetical protein IJ579_06820 [bacterium]|nr:hypothetical protein [bacterium]